MNFGLDIKRTPYTCTSYEQTVYHQAKRFDYFYKVYIVYVMYIWTYNIKNVTCKYYDINDTYTENDIGNSVSLQQSSVSFERDIFPFRFVAIKGILQENTHIILF